MPSDNNNDWNNIQARRTAREWRWRRYVTLAQIERDEFIESSDSQEEESEDSQIVYYRWDPSSSSSQINENNMDTSSDCEIVYEVQWTPRKPTVDLTMLDTVL